MINISFKRGEIIIKAGKCNHICPFYMKTGEARIFKFKRMIKKYTIAIVED